MLTRTEMGFDSFLYLLLSWKKEKKELVRKKEERKKKKDSGLERDDFRIPNYESSSMCCMYGCSTVYVWSMNRVDEVGKLLILLLLLPLERKKSPLRFERQHCIGGETTGESQNGRREKVKNFGRF